LQDRRKKTHLAISLAITAAQSGRRVYYDTLADLASSVFGAVAGTAAALALGQSRR